ncbi:DedA family protein [Candidatus Woesearchaeota archaeon]|nr:DedA family protein [Candidatus Woesearchaeota archaeon]
MGTLSTFLDIALHIDKYLGAIISQYGGWTYGLLFLIIFAETGFVFTPFLPGDSLLFAVGAFAAQDYLNIFWIFLLLALAAILGDSVNYWMGRHIGEKLLAKSRFIKPGYMERTKLFYEKHGKKTIILARFIPVVRTFAPFVAGIGKMEYLTFILYNILGGIIWVGLFVWGGYFFGNIPIVQEHFGAFIIGIILLSFIPLIVEVVKHYKNKKKE